METADDASLIHKEFLPEEFKLNPLTKKWNIQVPEPRVKNGLSDIDRLTRAFQEVIGDKEIIYYLSMIRNMADILRAENGKVTITAFIERDRFKVLAIDAGDLTTTHYAIAVDIGTTTVAVQLIYLATSRILATHKDYNSQPTCGRDVISRINYARKPERLKELRNRVLKTINHLIKQGIKNHPIISEQICSAAVSGNITMIHLWLGLKPEYIRLEPYPPTLLESPKFKAEESGSLSVGAGHEM